jgi:hypothetical protein
MPFVRATNHENAIVNLASALQHHHAPNHQGRSCEQCQSSWTCLRDNAGFHVWRNGEPEDDAILDWYGNNVAIECCIQ